MAGLDKPIDISAQLTMEEAIAIMKGGLGKAELEIVSSFCAPLYWVYLDENRQILTKNGSAYFLNAGKGPFGVTAFHVIKQWQEDRKNGCGPLRLAGEGRSVEFHFEDRAIAFHEGLDIATFHVTEEEVRNIGKTVLTGFQKTWPPLPPPQNCGIYYAGYPQNGTKQISIQMVQFGVVRGSGVATAINDRDVVCQFEREFWLPDPVRGAPPENYDFGGISGGLMLTVVQGSIRSWMLSGTIYEGPSTSEKAGEAIAGFEVIKARRAHFILSDGNLNTALWYSLGGT